MRALVSGTLAAAAVTLVASLAAKRASGSAAAALNATSHFLWKDRAARQDAYSLKYTGVGFLANYGASVFWALLYELLSLRRPRSRAQALRDGALVSGVAYLTDYHLVPRRLTPGSRCACRRWRSPASMRRWPSASACATYCAASRRMSA